jgi:hypothetical protein
VELEKAGDADRIRVSDRERQEIVELLGQAAAEGRLTLDEYTERTGSAYAAVTRADLDVLTTDLPVARPVPARPMASRTEGSLASVDEPEKMIAVFGNETRKGRWLVPRFMRTVAVFGDVHIEMQDAQLQHPVTQVDATVVFGATTIYVPEGVDVRLIGTAVFGAKEKRLRTPPRPGAPVVEVRCRVFFGAIEVKPSR